MKGLEAFQRRLPIFQRGLPIFRWRQGCGPVSSPGGLPGPSPPSSGDRASVCVPLDRASQETKAIYPRLWALGNWEGGAMSALLSEGRCGVGAGLRQ